MRARPKAVAFDVPAAGLACLQEALPEWEIDRVYGATVGSLPSNWNPMATDLLILGAREDVTETWELCRFLATCTAYSKDLREEAAEPAELRKDLRNLANRTPIPILVLLPQGREVRRGGVEAGITTVSCCHCGQEVAAIGSVARRQSTGPAR